MARARLGRASLGAIDNATDAWGGTVYETYRPWGAAPPGVDNELFALDLLLPPGTVKTAEHLLAVVKLVGQFGKSPGGFPWDILAAYLVSQTNAGDRVQLVLQWAKSFQIVPSFLPTPGGDAAGYSSDTWAQATARLEAFVRKETGNPSFSLLGSLWWRITAPEAEFWANSRGLALVPLWQQPGGQTKATVSPNPQQLKRGTDIQNPSGGESLVDELPGQSPPGGAGGGAALDGTFLWLLLAFGVGAAVLSSGGATRR